MRTGLNSIPVIILSGFLGSGKTTLLLKLMEETARRGLTPGILMNELGKYDVDGELVRLSMGPVPMEKLLDGCVCCTKKNEIDGALNTLIQKSPDLLFIELTGVADPEEIAEALSEPALASQLTLYRIITLIDAENALEYNSFFSADKSLIRTLRSQIHIADDLIINKSDLVSLSQRGKITEMVRKYNTAAPIYFTVRGAEYPLESLFTGLTSGISYQRKSQHTASEHDKSEGSFSRVGTMHLSVSDDQSLTEQKLKRFLKKWEHGLLRAKGYLPLNKPGKTSLFQYAGQRITTQTLTYEGPHYLILIGFQLDHQQIQADWSSL